MAWQADFFAENVGRAGHRHGSEKAENAASGMHAAQDVRM